MVVGATVKKFIFPFLRELNQNYDICPYVDSKQPEQTNKQRKKQTNKTEIDS